MAAEGSAPGAGHGDDVVQRFVRRIKKAPEVAAGLADPLLVLDEGNPDKAVAMFAETDARGDRHIGLLDQELGEFKRAEAANFSGIGAQANIDALGGGIVQPARPKLSTSASRRRR